MRGLFFFNKQKIFTFTIVTSLQEALTTYVIAKSEAPKQSIKLKKGY